MRMSGGGILGLESLWRADAIVLTSDWLIVEMMTLIVSLMLLGAHCGVEHEGRLTICWTKANSTKVDINMSVINLYVSDMRTSTKYRQNIGLLDQECQQGCITSQDNFSCV